VENHYVKTKDRYINLMFRVYKKSPFSKIKDLNNNLIPKPVILMQHGVADSSDSFILNDADKAPAFIAAS